MRDGREVVVKVQRPDIRDIIVGDLEALGEIAHFLDQHTELGKRYEFDNMLVNLRKSLLTRTRLHYRSQQSTYHRTKPRGV